VNSLNDSEKRGCESVEEGVGDSIGDRKSPSGKFSGYSGARHSSLADPTGKLFLGASTLFATGIAVRTLENLATKTSFIALAHVITPQNQK